MSISGRRLRASLWKTGFSSSPSGSEVWLQVCQVPRQKEHTVTVVFDSSDEIQSSGRQVLQERRSRVQCSCLIVVRTSLEATADLTGFPRQMHVFCLIYYLLATSFKETSQSSKLQRTEKKYSEHTTGQS